jgi:hypothetical protein
MPVTTTSEHRARLEVPVSANPAETVSVVPASSTDGRTILFVATSDVSPADAKRKIREFLQAARDAAQS